MKKRILWSAVPVLSALPAVLIGSLVMRLHGVSTSAYLQNLAALLIPGAGFGVYLSVARPAKPKARHGYAAMLGMAWPRSAAPFWIQGRTESTGGFR